MNAAKHPHKVFMRRRVVPAKYRWVLQPSDDCMEKIRSDLPDMSGKEQKVAEAVNLLWTCALLGLSEARERGYIVELPNGHEVRRLLFDRDDPDALIERAKDRR